MRRAIKGSSRLTRHQTLSIDACRCLNHNGGWTGQHIHSGPVLAASNGMGPAGSDKLIWICAFATLLCGKLSMGYGPVNSISSTICAVESAEPKGRSPKNVNRCGEHAYGADPEGHSSEL
jgi:hypothetical protein